MGGLVSTWAISALAESPEDLPARCLSLRMSVMNSGRDSRGWRGAISGTIRPDENTTRRLWS